MSEMAQDGKNSTDESVKSSTDVTTDKEIGGQSAPEKNLDDDLPAGIKKRFAKLTREKYEAKNRYDSLRSEFETFKKNFEQPKKYESNEEMIQDLVAIEIQKREKEASERRASEEKISKYTQKYNASDVSDIDDFDDVVNNVPIDLNHPIDRDIADFLINSDSGKRLTYEICKSPELLETLRQMSYSVRAKTLIKLDEQLYAGISAKNAQNVVDETIDEAADNSTQKKSVGSKLITPVTGKSTPKSGKLTMEEYMIQRNQRLAKQK